MPYRELILLVKEAKATSGITYKEIEDKTRKLGSPVSESSIKRIFAEGSENKVTKNDKTLMPIASVLLEPAAIREALRPKEEASDEVLGIIAMKEDRIDVLKRQFAAKEAEYQKRIAELEHQLVKTDEDHLRVIDILTKQIEKSDALTSERISYFKERLTRGDRISRILAIAFGSLLFAVFIAIVVDNFHPELGWIPYQDGALVIILAAFLLFAGFAMTVKLLRKK